MQAVSTKSFLTTATAAARALPARRALARRAGRVVVRSAEEPAQSAPTESANSSSATPPPPPPPPPAKKDVSFGEAMAFSGAGPETINGRLAMLGFIAALGAEASSGESIFQQIGDAEPSILFAFIMFAAASLIPIFKGVKKESFAFFSPEAEMLNGRAAMIGFALLIAIEAKSGAAFF
ncbi:chlorophyll A-B binding protein [Chloropicon primus]|uniref:Chlorophyll A-B binding protein n=1 Tax=Chloropicon primus TaxID=1764295 RepID=A0A5B8MM71_9CHLO|nr:chlorophyll A-B binding protein [Chloropicon primus]UPR00847.1 chlorophyll A-B binding protein [Chloropicon primus]|mmetsp:Transcript_3962/g.11513  ORF Transcript_3962/g.11513 Transcript_3962/m.11513 type:complete len:179 (+) Transcript_3962:448-984(+)|eukprot:QDZ21636.1 chlorophyll A-B binding protein [Chloropicon primus]